MKDYPRYYGITHYIRGEIFYKLWKKFLCRINWHLFDEVRGIEEHYLVCDSCQLVVNIKNIDNSYIE